MPVSKRRKPKSKHKRKLFATQSHKVGEGQTFFFREILLKYLPNIDKVQIRLHAMIGLQDIIILGLIDPDKSYNEGMLIETKSPQPWMTVKEIYISRKDCPNFFAVVLSYIYTAADLMDSGMDPSEVPEALISNNGEMMEDGDLLQHYEHIGRDEVDWDDYKR